MMMKKFGKVAATTLLGATLVGAGTFALFTSQKVNEGNSFAAGTVSVALDKDTTAVSSNKVLKISNLAPGDTGENTLTITNDGTLDAWVKLETVTSDPLFVGENKLQLSHTVKVGDTVVQEPFKLGKDQSAEVTYTYIFPKTAGDTYQGAEGTANITVKAVQAKNNDAKDFE